MKEDIANIDQITILAKDLSKKSKDVSFSGGKAKE